MITETIFIILVVAMLVFVALTMYFKNEAMGAFTIILCLIIATQLLPVVGGVQYQTGADINTTGDNTLVTNNYSDFTNVPLATLFFVIVLYLSMQIVTFRNDNRREREESVD
jgi:hypothetical protein